MKAHLERERIKVWRLPDLGNVELHRGQSVARSYPRHWHEEFHFCLIEGGAGELLYRGATHATPTGCLFIVHPGEVHANRAWDDDGCTFRNLYVRPESLQQALRDMDASGSLPFFPEPVLFDADLVTRYLRLHRVLEVQSSRLDRESRLLDFLAHLTGRFAAERPCRRRVGSERQSVERIRHYLTDNYAENISLKRLAEVAGLSPFHLNRTFSRELGLPPHAFQTQVRVLKAKQLLQQERPIAEVASATGFADQSHLTRHFKRVIGVAPGEYARNPKARPKQTGGDSSV
ncbi:MAG: AraC family ligand binding domain-containing protein [Terriglobales bacterium]